MKDKIKKELEKKVLPKIQALQEEVKLREEELTSYEDALVRYNNRLEKHQNELETSRTKDSYKNLLKDPKKYPKGTTGLRVQIEEIKDQIEDLENLITECKRDLRIAKDDLQEAAWMAIHGKDGVRRTYSLMKLDLENQVRTIEAAFYNACKEFKQEHGLKTFHPEGPNDAYYLGLRTEIERPENQVVFEPLPELDGSHITPLVHGRTILGNDAEGVAGRIRLNELPEGVDLSKVEVNLVPPGGSEILQEMEVSEHDG